MQVKQVTYSPFWPSRFKNLVMIISLVNCERSEHTLVGGVLKTQQRTNMYKFSASKSATHMFRHVGRRITSEIRELSDSTGLE